VGRSGLVMTMTLDDLNAHLFLIQKLNTARELLQSMRDSVLRASSYDGMPHAPGTRDKVGALAIKCAEQEETVAQYERLVKKSEKEIKEWIDTLQDNRLNVVFFLRFVCGYEWLEVADMTGSTENAVKSLAYRYFRSQAL
jgi:DNA-directed RNA polymerase specialized sigma24 family protein